MSGVPGRWEAECEVCGKPIFRLRDWGENEWHHVDTRKYYCYRKGGDKPVLSEYASPKPGTRHRVNE